MKTFTILLFLFASTFSYAQKKFPEFSYTTLQGAQISNADLAGKTSLIIIGHISCPGVLFLLKDIQKMNIDTIQFLLLLENTSAQIEAFNSNDTTNIWAYQRFAFKLNPVTIPTVTSCTREQIRIKPDGTVVIKNQCNKLKLKYGAFEAPKIYAVDQNGRVINKQTGWYNHLPDPQTKLIQFLQGIK